MPLEGVAEFNAELESFTRDLLPREVRTVQKKLALDVLRGVVKRTPVDTGRARGNWQLTVGQPAENEVGAEKSVGAVVSNGRGALDGLRNYDTAWISNNVPYINVLEEGAFIPPDPGPSDDPRKGREGRTLVAGGYSVQAPRGMVAVTLEELRDQLGD